MRHLGADTWGMQGERVAAVARRGALALCAGAFLVLPASASAASAPEAATAAQLVKDATAVPVGWTGATNTCTPVPSRPPPSTPRCAR